MHIYTCTYIHACMHACMHTYIHTYRSIDLPDAELSECVSRNSKNRMYQETPIQKETHRVSLYIGYILYTWYVLLGGYAKIYPILRVYF